jgi:signal transduction histidine kinase
MNIRRRHPSARDLVRLDTLLASVALIEIELECWLGHQVVEQHRTVTAVAAVLFTAPVIARRAAPRAALITCLSVGVVQTSLGGQLLTAVIGGVVPVIALAYAVGAWLEYRQSAATAGIGIALLLAAQLLPGDGGPPDSVGQLAAAIGSSLFLIIPAWFVGRLARERSRRATAFRAFAVEAATAQQESEAAAIAQERARISGEFQDIVAHTVGVMVVHAGAARLTLRSDPGQARTSILTIEQTGRQALADLRQLLGVLRATDDPHALTPQPGLAQLGSLIESVGRTGLACELTSVGLAADLTPGIDLVAYRVIEATLTTAADHNVGHGLITLIYQPHQIEVHVTGDGPIPRLAEQLQATTERVALYDGTLHAFAQDDRGGFAVRAVLPFLALVRT